MIGSGAADATVAIPAGAIALNATFGEPDQMYRIVLGAGQDSQLRTDGLVSAAGLCPGGIPNEDYISYNNYNVIVPRLAATVARLLATGTATGPAARAPIEVTMAGYDEDGNTTNQIRKVAINVPQEYWQFATQCPEGHKYPASASDTWRVTNVVTATP
ncbi:MAG: hypothetical protein DDT40_00761 [candidate division WS2 bacterium]|nr:hypothetical protein [Candidatus Psychracetigena formicireducens]